MSTGTFVAGFFIGAILTGALGFATLSILEPEETGGILQVKYEEFRSAAFIMDSSTSDWTKIPDTEVNITTEGNSRLSVTFSATGLLHLDTTFSGACKFNISLHIEGITSKQTRVSHFQNPGPGAMTELSKIVSIHLETETLPKGEYQIVVYWIASFDGTGTNQLNLGSSNFNFTRSLSVWEIST